MAMDRTGLVDEQALPFHIIATAVFVAALAVTGCTSHTDQPVAPVSSGP